MITEDGPDVYGHTTFCDDIRLEVGNKITLVGTYTGQLVVNSFPFVMPKLAMQIVYCQRRPKFIMPSKFLIFLPEAARDKPTFELNLPPESGEDKLAALLSSNADQTEPVYGRVALQFSIQNLILQQPGFIKVRAVREDKLIRLGSLQVLPAPEPPGQAEAAQKPAT